MKNILVISGIAVAGLFWACGDGTIATKSGDDEMALLNYGEFNPGGMSGLVGEALKACQEDPKCAEAMANSDVVVPADTDTESSDASADTSSSTTDSTGTKPSANSSSGATPASATGSSSSATEPSGNSSSSANVAPGSSSATTSSSSAALPTKIRGACSGTSPAEKNTDVKWTFANLTPALKPKSFKWTFEEGASKLSSTDESPVVQYTTPNMLKGYGATLVVDEGLETESDPIPCTVVKITGIQVKDCECTASATTVVASESKPKDVTWTVDKCSGGTSFTYEWSNGASGAGASTTVSVKSGSITPKVTITNEDGMNMTRTCPTVTVTEPTEITSTGCKINSSNKFDPGTSFSGWNGNTLGRNLLMDLYRDNTKLTSFNVSMDYNDPNSLPTATTPTEAGSYDFRLVYQDNEVCKVTKTVPLTRPSCNIGAVGSASGTSYTAIPGQQFAFKPGNSNYPGGTKMVTLEFNGSTQQIEAKPSNNTETVLDAPDALGSYTVKLSDDNGQVCTATLKVDYPKPSCYVGISSNPTASSAKVLPGDMVYFKPSNTNFAGTSFDMEFSFNGSQEDYALLPSNNTAKELTAPSELGEYPVTLSYDGNTACTATVIVSEYREVTATGTYTGPLKIEFVNTKTCQIAPSSNSWGDWIVSGTIASNWGNGGQIRGTIKVNIPSGESFKIESCW